MSRLCCCTQRHGSAFEPLVDDGDAQGSSASGRAEADVSPACQSSRLECAHCLALTPSSCRPPCLDHGQPPMQACEGPHQLPTPTQGALFGLMRHAARTDNLEEKDAAALTDPRAVWAEVRAGQYMYGAAVIRWEDAPRRRPFCWSWATDSTPCVLSHHRGRQIVVRGRMTRRYVTSQLLGSRRRRCSRKDAGPHESSPHPFGAACRRLASLPASLA